MSTERRRKPSANKRLALQHLLGELGTVLERQNHGSPERPAQGWYAELVDGEVVFLGDYFAIAVLRIQQIRASADA